jgi:hypothetical protein
MVFIFKSEGCPACRQISNEFQSNLYPTWTGHVKFVDVKFNEEEQCNKAYIDGKETEGRAPVDAVPALYCTESETLIYGYDQIKEYLLNEHK